jgi:ATP-binding cassette subfamily F protein 3
MGSMAKIMYHLSNPALYLSDNLYHSQYDPNSLQYMLEFFRNVAQTIPASPPSPTTSPDHPAEAVPIEPMHGSARDMLQDRAGIIVLREDLDFYAIPPHRDITQPEMIEVKRAAGEALLRQDGIFSGLRKSEEPGTTEQHLIEMLTAGYVSSASACEPCLLIRIVASTTTINGVTVPASPTRPSSAASRSHA